ncbi:MAG: hypothetical protein ACKOOL_06410 [Novosphingobium sp.]
MDGLGWLTAIAVIARVFLPLYVADNLLLFDNYFDTPGYRNFTPDHPWPIDVIGRNLFVDNLGWWLGQVSNWGLYFILWMVCTYAIITLRKPALLEVNQA